MRSAAALAVACVTFLVTVTLVAGSSVARGALNSPGLVAAYSFDTGSGSTLADASGRGNTGTIAGATWTAAGKSGGAMSFDGAFDWVSVADTTAFDLNNGMTIEAWVKPSTLDDRWRTVLEKSRNGRVTFGLFATDDAARSAAQVSVTNVRTARGPTLEAGSWSHLAATYDGSALRLYVNGTLTSSLGVNGDIRDSPDPLYIGGTPEGEWFAGLIDEVRIYNRPLSSDELQGDMSTPVEPDLRPPTAPAGLTIARATQSEIEVRWNPSADNTGVAGYGYYLNTAGAGSGSDTRHTYSNLACGTSYELAVDAFDAAGNHSGQSSIIASTSACPDTLAPTAPTGLLINSRMQTEVTLTWQPSTDNVGVTGYAFFRDGARISSGAETRYTFSGLACGRGYTLAVTAFDGAGNESAASTISATTSACASQSSPVVAYSFDAGSGTTLTDHSGSGNTGTIAGATWTSGGRYGGGLTFDGVDDLVTIQDAASLDLTTGMTLEAWVHAASSPSWTTVVTKEQTGNLVYGLFSNSASGRPASIVSIGSSPIQEIVQAPVALDLLAWKHLAATYDGSALRMYVDGVLVSTESVSGAMPNSSGPLRIGGNGVWSEWFQGQIDDLRVYNRALSVSELQADMSTPVAPPLSPPPTDTQAPTPPGGVRVASVSQSSAAVSWSAASDNVGVAGYGYYRDGSLVENGTGTSYTFTSLTCGKSYTFSIDAFDAAGNRSAKASVTASTSACPTSPPPDSGGANLWVDTSGGTCVRQASRVSYADSAACSWNQAYQAAQTGDLILVRGGNYGNVTIGPNRSSITAPGITFRAATGEGVVVNDFVNGHIAGAEGGSNISFIGPVSARTFRSDQASNVLVDGWNIDCNGCESVQTFHLEAADNVTVLNSEIQDNRNDSLMWISGSNLTFENNKIHDAALPAGSTAHTECLYAWRVTNLTLKRNHFWHCSVMDVFITGGDVANGGYIENNVFEKPWESTGVISNSALAFHFRDGGSPSPDPSNWDFRYNTFAGPLNITTDENPVGAGGMRVTGNLFMSGAPCGHANATYSHNAFVTNGCGTNSLVNSVAVYLLGFLSLGDPGDFSLSLASVLRDKGNPNSYPPVDAKGNSRPVGSAPDIGAFEFR